MTENSLSRYADGWAPAPSTDVDVIDADRVARLADILDADPVPRSLPLSWHWGFYPNWPAHRDLNEDGHPAGGTYQPPIPGRRRMWAGGALQQHADIAIGEPLERTAALQSVDAKSGRSGDMLLIAVSYEYRQNGTLCVSEIQNHVYRGPDTGGDGPSWGDRPSTAVTASTPWHDPIHTDPIQLFRMSALTANSHRIHYDRPYAVEVEGYPSLVVHGPLLAMRLAGLPAHHDRSLRIATFDYRVTSPVFVGEPVAATGTPYTTAGNLSADLSVVSAGGTVHVSASATF